jgi:hypothetical protein
MLRSVISIAVIWCLLISVVLLYGASAYQKCCYMVRRVISSAFIWCVVLQLVLLYGA